MTTPQLNPTVEFTQARRNYMLALLTAVYVFNFIDRQIVVILQESIKADLNLSDFQLGLLSGISFALFYCVLGVPIARWADRSNRSRIIAGGLAVWSGMTAICGLAQNFVQLFFARVGVGVGESACSPPAHSIIADLFPKKSRASAFSVYNVGIYIGIMIGYVVGGMLEPHIGWRLTFMVIGVPGILFAAILLHQLKEPPRGMADGVVAASSTVPLSEVIQVMWSRRSFRHFALASGFSAFVLYAANFLAPFLSRAHGMNTAAIGVQLGIAQAIGGAGGALLGGFLTDRLARRDVRWYAWFPMICILIALPFNVGAYLAPNAIMSIVFANTALFFTITYLGPTLAMVQSVVSLRMRALASSVLFFVLNILGLGLGPAVTGKLADIFAVNYNMGKAEGLRMAMIIVAFVALLAAWQYFLGSRHYKADLAAAEQSAAANKPA